MRVSGEARKHTVPPFGDLGGRHRHLRAALAPTAVHDREYEGVLAEVEVLLGLEADLLAQTRLRSLDSTAQPVVALVNVAADRGERGAKLDAR